MVGRTVLHYRIIGVLDSGGMGVVYDAEDLKLNRRGGHLSVGTGRPLNHLYADDGDRQQSVEPARRRRPSDATDAFRPR